MNNKKLLIFNTAVLTFTGFLMKSISVAFNVYLTSKIGAAGIGLFQLIINVYSLFVTFGCAGIKLATTRLITENISTQLTDERKIMLRCIKYALLCGCIITTVLFSASGIISTKWISDPKAVNALRILSVSLPFVSVSASFNGYFTAKKTLLNYAAILFVEEGFKIFLTTKLLKLCSGMDAGIMCSAICISISLSEILSAVLSLVFYCCKRNKKKHSKNHLPIIRLLRISVPDLMGSGFRSVLITIEHLMIPKGLKKSGQSYENALSVYGNIHGMALPVILYPATVLVSLSNMLVPELSEMLACGQHKRINSAANRCLRLAYIFSIGTSFFIFTFSELISQTVYKDNSTSEYLKLLSLLLPIMYLDTVTDGLLKGLDQQLYSMKYNILDSGLCVILVWFLLPKCEVKGYIFIIFISEILNFSLSINRLSKITVLKFNLWHDFFIPALTAAFSSVVINHLSNILLFNANEKLHMIICLTCFTVLYCLLLKAIKSLSAETKIKIFSGNKKTTPITLD